MKRARFYLLVSSLLIGLVAAALIIFRPSLSGRHMGRVETLHAPITITGWTSAGLNAADGHIIPIPGIQNLPATSLALTQATQRGLEINSAGQLTCLVRVYRWCGNDPIIAEILRVDLSDMLTYLRVGDPTVPTANPRLLAREAGGSFDPSAGWDVSDYTSFIGWQSMKDMPLGP